MRNSLGTLLPPEAVSHSPIPPSPHSPSPRGGQSRPGLLWARADAGSLTRSDVANAPLPLSHDLRPPAARRPAGSRRYLGLRWGGIRAEVRVLTGQSARAGRRRHLTEDDGRSGIGRRRL